MSFALSQRRPDRHPVGLLIVIGLHVVLAAALLSAKLQRDATHEVFVMKPIDEPVKPPPPKPVDLPPPQRVLPHDTILVPKVDLVEPPLPDTIIVEKRDDTPPQPPVEVASIGPDVPRQAPHIEPRAAHINAGAAQCHPEYPAAAQRVGATGSTRIRFTVDALGRIAGSQIVHASGPTREHRLMDQAAAAALAQCPVQVGTDDQGRPVGTTTDVVYDWTLN